ncbi:outer membrane NlpB-like protein [Methylophaga lonarensis MPL]|uniref:Outer membrane NlpB-like protein n=1 Tax=Methylophaga lonarensis MPL TaxID=1286106 RepID=M7P4B3_9GAMM|nr:outer membrane protein assembly factor BamC [Methylophaga lonarensis]EMR14336.1 outer membrane NlpB-like protein [Methylophaga lonarensis MPL]
MNVKSFKNGFLTLAIGIAVTGCGALERVVPDTTENYRRADTMPPLDIPPDLSTSRINDDIAGTTQSTATFSEYEEAANNPLAARYNIVPEARPTLTGEGDDRVLTVPGDRDQTWQRVNAFWAEQRIGIRRADERIGLMDTENDPEGYSYRLRMERGDSGRSARIRLTGRDESNINRQKDEAMMRQLADYLGTLFQQERQVAQARQATQPSQTSVRVTMVDEGDGQQLLVEQEFSDVWGRVGRVLDTRGFRVEDRDRTRGTYFVRYIDPFSEVEREKRGLLSRMAFWRSAAEVAPEEYYYIRLISDASDTRIIILDAEERRTNSDTARRLLDLLQEQLTQ